MKKVKVRSKVRKLLLLACMLAMILSNLSLAASPKMIYAEELESDKQSVDAAHFEISQGETADSDQSGESQGEPIDHNQSGNGQSELVDPNQQGNSQEESVKAGSLGDKQNLENQSSEQTVETPAENDATGAIPQQEGPSAQSAEMQNNSVIQERVDFNQIPRVLITELSPNSKGGGTDYYEYIELYNNTNQPLSTDKYSFIYKYTDTGVEKPFYVPAVTIAPQQTIVYWYNNGNLTLADFNANFGSNLSADQVVEFKDVFPGFANTGFRALVIKDQAGAEVVSASYLAEENDNNGAGIEYKYPASGTVMEKYLVLAAPTPGVIDAEQVPAIPVNLDETPADEEAPVITHTPVTDSDAFSPVKIDAIVTDNMAQPFVTLYYKTMGEQNFTSISLNASKDDSTKYSAEIPGVNVESDITYYIEASDGTNTSKTEEYLIKVKKSEIDFNKLPAFLVTEVVPDSTNVGSADGYEFIEIYNNTDKDVNFKDYKIQYRYGTDPATDVIWASIPDDVVVPSQKTLVFWIINDQNPHKTVADFNANYGTGLIENKDIVRIYSAGMANASQEDWL